jgi:uroporphyrinogen-III decarboxylase
MKEQLQAMIEQVEAVSGDTPIIGLCKAMVHLIESMEDQQEAILALVDRVECVENHLVMLSERGYMPYKFNVKGQDGN